MGKRIIIGILLTLIIFFTARLLSKNNSEHIILKKDGVRVEHFTVFEHVGSGRPSVRIKVTPSDSISVSLAYIHLRDNARENIKMRKGDPGIWEADLPNFNKGERLKYSFLLYRNEERMLRVPGGEAHYLLKYKGNVSSAVLILHIVFMFFAFFFIIETFLGALGILFSGEGIEYAIRMMRIGLSCLFVGGGPLGFVLNYQRFGPVWEGFPFGWDITDNKTQIIFISWLVTTFLVKGSFFGRGERRDLIDGKRYAFAVVISFIITVGLYLVPHSL